MEPLEIGFLPALRLPWQGKVVATAVNAPMVPPEVLAELQPYVALAQGLARAAVQLVATDAHGFADVFISYASSRGDDLDTRLLRAMVIKGILEQARPPRLAESWALLDCYRSAPVRAGYPAEC